MTSQRALLLELVRQQDGHADAEEICRKARHKIPRISLSTVYRNLQLFQKLGLVQEHHFDEAHHHYEAKPTSEHHHLVCLKCGEIVEFSLLQGKRLKSQIEKTYGFEIVDSEISFSGICSRCRSKAGEARGMEARRQDG